MSAPVRFLGVDLDPATFRLVDPPVVEKDLCPCGSAEPCGDPWHGAR